MASTFKELGSADIATTKTLLHEAIPLTGTISSGTYVQGTTETNIKNYSHGIFQSVYDYPYLSSSANHIYDLTVGFSSDSALSAAAAPNQQSKKINVYTQMAQLLVGYDETGSVRNFDQDGNIIAGGTKINEAIFITFSRLLVKDEIKKESFTLVIDTGSVDGATGAIPEFTTDTMITCSDFSASTAYKTNSPAGEYGLLYTSSAAAPASHLPVGLIFYQAGVAVLTASLFTAHGPADTQFGPNLVANHFDTGSINRMFTGSNISSSCDAFRNRIYNLEFNNTTELNSTVYFCRANHNEFNYSSNPTYLSGTNGASEVVVKNGDPANPPVSYLTTIGLYSPDNELLAVAKLSEPLKNTPSNEATFRVRLDY
jgi:hypothetical protein